MAGSPHVRAANCHGAVFSVSLRLSILVARGAEFGCLCGLTVIGSTNVPLFCILLAALMLCIDGRPRCWQIPCAAVHFCASEPLIGCLSGLTDISPYVERSAGFKPAG